MLRRRFEAEIAVDCDFSRINFQANNTKIQTNLIYMTFWQRFEAENDQMTKWATKISLSDSFWALKHPLNIFGPITLPKRHRRQYVVKTSWYMNAAL